MYITIDGVNYDSLMAYLSSYFKLKHLTCAYILLPKYDCGTHGV